jgi:hypothetical protein
VHDARHNIDRCEYDLPIGVYNRDQHS